MEVYICSRPEMELYIKYHMLPENTAIVSFADTVEEFISFPIGVDVLCVPFYDVRPYTVSKDHYDKVLPEAKKIAKYVDQKRKEGKNLICQCDYGISRSAGLAAAILERWGANGISIFADYRYTPNQFVFTKVLKELKEIYYDSKKKKA